MSGLDLAPPPSLGSHAKESVKETTSVQVEASSSSSGGGASQSLNQFQKEEPHTLADQVYESLCKDAEEKPTAKGQQSFRDKVFESCTSNAIVLTNARIGAHACITLVKYMKNHSAVLSTTHTSPERTGPGGRDVSPAAKKSTGVPGGKRFFRLDLSSNNLQNYGVFEILKAVRYLPTLKHVNLSCNNIGNKGGLEVAKLLASNDTLQTLELGSTDACFKKNHLEAKETQRLAVALCRNKTLQYLGLKHNKFNLPEGGNANASASSANTTLPGQGKDQTALTQQQTGPQGAGQIIATQAGLKAAETFAVMFQRNKTLTAVNFESCALGTRGAAVILAALTQNNSLRHINLASNGLDSAVGRTLEQVLQTNHALCSVNLAYNDLGAAGVQIFAPALVNANQSLLVLDLEGNGLGDLGAETLSHMLRTNRTLTQVNLALNGITERGGKAIAETLGFNPVLTSLNLSSNAIKNPSCMTLAESLLTNRSLLSLDLCSCKIGDEGVIALVSAVGNNDALTLRKLRLRDNYISGHAGEIIVDSLYRNTSLTLADFRGNQIDHVRLNKIRVICKRNLDEIKDAEPRRLRKEIARLRGEQVKLRKAENTLKQYQLSIAETRSKIELIERDKATFLATQNERREEIRLQIQKELASIRESKLKLEEKKHELGSIEETYQEKLSELQKGLEKEIDSRRAMETELQRVKKELEETIKDRPNKIQELKEQIELVKSEKVLFQNNLTNIRKELLRLQQSYHDGHPIPNLIEQAKSLLVTYQTSLPQPTNFTELEEKKKQALAEAEAAKLKEEQDAIERAKKQEQQASQQQQEQAAPQEPEEEEDPEMKELRLMVEEQMKNK